MEVERSLRVLEALSVSSAPWRVEPQSETCGARLTGTACLESRL